MDTFAFLLQKYQFMFRPNFEVLIQVTVCLRQKNLIVASQFQKTANSFSGFLLMSLKQEWRIVF